MCGGGGGGGGGRREEGIRESEVHARKKVQGGIFWLVATSPN